MKIKDYTLDSEINADDKVIGTRHSDNATKNFRIGDIAAALVADQTLQEVLDNNHDLVDGNNFQGTQAGLNQTGTNVIALGTNSGEENTGQLNVFAGQESGRYNTGDDVVALGYLSSNSNEGDNVVSFGSNAAKSNQGSFVNGIGATAAYENQGNYVNAIGRYAASGNTGNNVNAFGVNAAMNNHINGQTIFSNNSLPSYANATAAAAAITTGNGASTGCTYLYFDASTGIVKAIRIA